MTTETPRTAAVTGAGSGIGRALATLLAQRGDRLRLTDIDGRALNAVSSQLGAEFSRITDVADAADMQSFADGIGPVDLLCLNAGVLSTSMGPPWEASPTEWNRVLGVNLHGVVNGLRSFVPLLLARDQPCQILITASLASAATWPGGGPYAASKHAVLAVAEQAALELSESQISVTALCPALVRTAMSEVGDDPIDVAALALEAVAEGRFAVIPDGWSSALFTRARMLAEGSQPRAPTHDRT